MDMDFANPLRFKPSDYCGIAVLRTPAPTTLEDIEALVERLIDATQYRTVKGELWIIQKERIRIYTPDES